MKSGTPWIARTRIRAVLAPVINGVAEPRRTPQRDADAQHTPPNAPTWRAHKLTNTNSETDACEICNGTVCCFRGGVPRNLLGCAVQIPLHAVVRVPSQVERVTDA